MTALPRAATSGLTTTERRLLFATGVVALAVFLCLAAWARFTALGDWERVVVIGLALQDNAAGDVVTLVNRLGNLDLWAVVVAVAALAVGWLRGVRAGVLIAASFAVDLVNWLFKVLVERARPDLDLSQVVLGLEDRGFPSGHTARAAALAGVLVFVLAPARWRLGASIAAATVTGVAMGYARIALGVHFPLDIMGGATLGLAWFALMTVLILGAALPAMSARPKPGAWRSGR